MVGPLPAPWAGALMNVWLDDKRPMPPGYDVHVTSAHEAINLLLHEPVVVISLDHDLGDETVVGTGYIVAKAIEELAHSKRLGRITVLIHTQNPVGRQNMEAALRSAEKAWNPLD